MKIEEKTALKTYIVTSFDGWNWNYWLIPENELPLYNDGSFEHREYKYYEIARELSKEEFKKLTGDTRTTNRRSYTLYVSSWE